MSFIDLFKKIPIPCSYSTFLADFCRWVGQAEAPNTRKKGEKSSFEKG